jgi:hypothetical protein
MITRTYQCLDCHTMFEVDHDRADEPEPPCPACDVTLQWVPKSFNIGTNKGKALDMTQRILEEDYQVPNFRDNMREGDTAAIAEPEVKEMKEAKERLRDEVRAEANKMDEQNNPEVQRSLKIFFGGGDSGMFQANLPAALSGAKTGPGAFTPESNPIARLHRAGQQGYLPNNMRIVARG